MRRASLYVLTLVPARFFMTGVYAPHSCESSQKEATMATTVIHAKVLAGNKKFMAAFGQKNAEALAKLYTRDGQLLPPGRGRATATSRPTGDAAPQPLSSRAGRSAGDG